VGILPVPRVGIVLPAMVPGVGIVLPAMVPGVGMVGIHLSVHSLPVHPGYTPVLHCTVLYVCGATGPAAAE